MRFLKRWPRLFLPLAFCLLAGWALVSAYLGDESPAPSARSAAPAAAVPAACEVQANFPSSELAAACQAEAAAWKTRLRRDCHIDVAPPFVLAGDLSPAELEHWRRVTIEPAAEILWRQYVRRRPDQPVVILLFGSERRYRAEAERLFADRHVSVYGYYKPSRRCLVLNMSRGGGTLLHELTHALVDFDFPQIPDWFNEGLASLHEACRLRPARLELEPQHNWRLVRLQQALRDGKLPPLMALVRSGAFLHQDVGLNYAHARYVCLYLHEQGKLARFYRAFRDAHAADPDGLRTLLAVTGQRSAQELDAAFRLWVERIAEEAAAQGIE